MIELPAFSEEEANEAIRRSRFEINDQSREAKNSILGAFGEAMAVKLYQLLGKTAVLSSDYYDSEKDLEVEGRKVEVKTQVPNIYQNIFTFRPNQRKKIASCDELLLIAIPHTTIPCDWVNKIYRVIPDEAFRTLVNNKILKIQYLFTQGKKEKTPMLTIPYKGFSQIECVATFSEEDAELLKHFIVSDY